MSKGTFLSFEFKIYIAYHLAKRLHGGSEKIRFVSLSDHQWKPAADPGFDEGGGGGFG